METKKRKWTQKWKRKPIQKWTEKLQSRSKPKVETRLWCRKGNETIERMILQIKAANRNKQKQNQNQHEKNKTQIKSIRRSTPTS